MARGTKERVDDLETALKDFTRSVGLEFNKLNSTVTRSEKKFDEFKDEMRDFKVEMQDFKAESKVAWDDMNRKWGHLTDKMGTMVEDLIHPSMLAALSVPENLLSFAERRGFLLITLGGTLMECLNAPDFQPREF